MSTRLDRFSGWPEASRSFFAEHNLGYRVDCGFHLILNVRAKCGLKGWSDNLFWQLQGAENEEKLAAAWKELEALVPKHAEYLHKIPENEFIPLIIAKDKGVFLFGEHTNDFSESLHSAEARVTRNLPIVSLMLDIFQRSSSQLQAAREVAQRSVGRCPLIPYFQKQFDEEIKDADRFRLVSTSVTGPFSAKVVHESANDASHAAQVTVKPGKMSCSRCSIAAQVCYPRLSLILTCLSAKLPLRALPSLIVAQSRPCWVSFRLLPDIFRSILSRRLCGRSSTWH